MRKRRNIFFALILVSFALTVPDTVSAAAVFVNPLVKNPAAGCAPGNLRDERFASEVSASDRIKLCRAVDKIASRLNSVAWSPELASELRGVWHIFSTKAVSLHLVPKNNASQIQAMADLFPSGEVGAVFESALYVRPERAEHELFFFVFLHELRHIYDFHQTWLNRGAMGTLEIERRGCLLTSRLAQETPERENFSSLPKLWNDEWQKFSAAQIEQKRIAAVENFLQGNKIYRKISSVAENQLDFTSLKN